MPGQSRPVLFFSPHCDECRRARPLIESLLSRPGWRNAEWVDSRLVSNLSLRDRFDAAFRVSDPLRGHTPALFHSGGALVGEAALRSALAQPTPPPDAWDGPSASGFPWGEWADSCLAGSSLFILAFLLGPYNHTARWLGLGLLTATFLVAGVDKVLHPADFAGTVQRMNLFPPGVARLAPLLGYVETGLGAALLLPRTRTTALVSVCALLLFFSAITVALLARHYAGNCGCMPWSRPVSYGKLVDGAFPLLVGIALIRVGWDGTVNSRTTPNH